MISNPRASHRRTRQALSIVAVIVLATAAGACSRGRPHHRPGGPPGTHTRPDRPTRPGGSTTTPATNPVTFELADFTIALTSGEVKSGRNTVTAVNVGQYEHEIEFFVAESATSLPTRPDGSVDTAAVPRANILGELELEPGATDTGTFTFRPGTYVALCNIVYNGNAHFARGQFLEFTVT